MKYILISMLFTGCCWGHSPQNKSEPKFTVGQEVKIRTGFYKDNNFIPERAFLAYCRTTDYTVWIYKGFVYVKGIGNIEDITFCEEDLQ